MRNLLIISLLIIAKSFQAQEWKWVKLYSGTDVDEIHAIAGNKNGDFAITGKFKSQFNFNDIQKVMTAPNQYDGFIGKYNSDGIFIWGQEFGKAGDECGETVHIDNQGNVIFSGNFTGESLLLKPFDLKKTAMQTEFLAKVAVDGKVSWAKIINTIGVNCMIKSIATASNGDVYVSGTYTGGDLTIDNITLKNKGSWDVFFAKFSSSNGKIIWAKSVSNIGNDYAGDISINENDEIFSSGWTYAATYGDSIQIVDKEYLARANYNGYAGKITSSGETQWLQLFYGKGGVFIDGLSASGQNVYVSGYFSKGHHTLADTAFVSDAANNIFLASFDLNGNRQWQNVFPAGELGRVRTLKTDKAGNAVLAGYLGSTASFDQITLTGATTSDFQYFISKINPAGQTVFALNCGSKVNSASNGLIACDDNENIYLAGYSPVSPVKFGRFEVTPLGKGDSYVAKLYGYVPPVVQIAENQPVEQEKPTIPIETPKESKTQTKAKEASAKDKADAEKLKKEILAENQAVNKAESALQAKARQDSIAKVNAEAKLKAAEAAKAKQEALAKQQAEAKEKAAADAKAKQAANADAKAKAAAEAQAKKEEIEKLQAAAKEKAAEQAKARQEAIAKSQAEAKEKQELAKAKAAEEAKLKAEKLAQQKAEQKTKTEPVDNQPYDATKERVTPNPTTGTFKLLVPAGTKSIMILDKDDSFVYHNFDYYPAEKEITINLENQKGTFKIKVQTKAGKEYIYSVTKN